MLILPILPCAFMTVLVLLVVLSFYKYIAKWRSLVVSFFTVFSLKSQQVEKMEHKSGDFLVKITKKHVVVPIEPTIQEQRMPQSNLDLLFGPIYVSVFFCYKKPSSGIGFSSMVSILKNSLGKALVSYYPFAGVMVKNAAGEPEVLCNNRGVDFTEAFAQIELHELDLYKPDESFRGKLLPNLKQGFFAVQATELKCGGLVVGCTFDHQVADGYSANLFFVSWSEMARLGSLSYEPSFHRSFLKPRFPAPSNPSINDHYAPELDYNLQTKNQAYISRIYSVSSHYISQFQMSTKPGTSKYEAFSAFLWKTVSKSKNSSNRNNYSRLSVAVDGRKRMYNPSLMTTYFGNVVSLPFWKAKIDQLQDMPLSWVADEVHKLIEQTMTKEHFHGLIDYVEANRPGTTVFRVCADKATIDEPAFLVSSGQRFPVTKIDFGWGSPAFGSFYFPWGEQGIQCGYVMPMPSASGNGDWVIYMHLYKEQIDAIETYASHVFKPVKSAYI